MELLSFPELDDLQRDWLRKFIAAVTLIALDDPVKEEAIELRRNHRLRLPDAIIAASAITSKAVLFTNDEGPPCSRSPDRTTSLAVAGLPVEPLPRP